MSKEGNAIAAAKAPVYSGLIADYHMRSFSVRRGSGSS
jgi:hypothetical protein